MEDRLNCPECGTLLQLSSLLHELRRAIEDSDPPVLVDLQRPVACFLALGPVGLFSTFILSDFGMLWVVPVLMFGVMVLWGVFLVKAWQSFQGPLGVAMSLLLHVIWCGYIVSGVSIVIGLLLLIGAMINLSISWPHLITSVLMIVLAVLMIRMFHQLHRWLDRRCVRHHAAQLSCALGDRR